MATTTLLHGDHLFSNVSLVLYQGFSKNNNVNTLKDAYNLHYDMEYRLSSNIGKPKVLLGAHGAFPESYAHRNPWATYMLAGNPL